MYSNTSYFASYFNAAFDVFFDTGVESFAFGVRAAACIVQQLQGCSTIIHGLPHKHAIKFSIVFRFFCTLHTRRVAGFEQVVSKKSQGMSKCSTATQKRRGREGGEGGREGWEGGRWEWEGERWGRRRRYVN